MFSSGTSTRTLLLALILLLAACSGSGTSTAPGPVVRPTSEVIASDEVPTMQELRDSGLTDDQAECFITTMDPDGNGRIEDADLFMEAFSGCVANAE